MGAVKEHGGIFTNYKVSVTFSNSAICSGPEILNNSC